MTECKTMPLTTSIKNYLLQRIAKAGTEPEKLPSEMELCTKFGVSRITVRRAIESLEQISYIIRIPGRQGAFTNPKVAMAVPHIIGILGGNGTRNYVNAPTAEILTGFMAEMKDADCDFEFMILNISGNQDAAREIENMALDGLLWIMPDDEMIDPINRLVQENYPIVTLGSIYNSTLRIPEGNTIYRNFGQIGVTTAELMLQNNFKNVARLGIYNISSEVFRNQMRKAGISLSRDYFIETPEEITEKLTKLLKSKKVDAVICNGSLDRYEKAIRTLRQKEDWKKIPLYLDDYRLERKLKDSCPDLNIRLLPKTEFLKTYGEAAGHCMKKLISGEIKSFESFQIPIQNKEE